MKRFLKLALSITNKLSFVFLLGFGAFGVYEQIMGPGGLERLLARLHIPLVYGQFLLVAYVVLASFLLSYFLRKKYFKQLPKQEPSHQP